MHVLAGLAQHLGEALVERRDAGAGIDHEQDDVGVADRDLGLLAHPVFEAAIADILVAGGVEHAEFQIAEPPLALAAVAGDAGLVVDQRELPADQPVEQRRFADIGPADNSDGDAHADCTGWIWRLSGSRRPPERRIAGAAVGRRLAARRTGSGSLVGVARAREGRLGYCRA